MINSLTFSICSLLKYVGFNFSHEKKPGKTRQRKILENRKWEDENNNKDIREIWKDDCSIVCLFIDGHCGATSCSLQLSG